MPALNQSAITLLASVADVDMNTGDPTELFTVPAGVTGCVISSVVVRGASISLTTASYSFGFNDPDYNDVIADAVHTELVDGTVCVIIPAADGAKIGTPGDILKAHMNTLQGGAATADMDVFGYLY